jgi:glutathione S-transferase
MTLAFYFAPGSSSMAPHIALHEIGAPFESKPLSFARRETQRPEFLALNPEGKVPTLVIDGRALTEVAGILFYLAKRFPEAKLLSAGDPEAEAQVISWMSFCAATLHPARTRGHEHANMVWSIADRKLGARDWVTGVYGIADIHLFRLYWRFARSAKPAPGSFPNLAAHHERMMGRAAVKRTIEIEAAIGYELPP